MKNKNLLYTLAVLAICITGSGCKKYLSEMPDNRTTINSKEKVDKLLAGAYDGPAHFAFTEPMSDNVLDGGKVTAFDQVNDFSYRWKTNDIDEDGSSPIGYWLACYKSIAVANQALASIEKLQGTADISASKGEALLIRAYYHFMLVNLWAKHYDPATAATDLGVPYVQEVEDEPFKRYKRASVKEVYDLVERDMLEGMALIQTNTTAPKFKFSPEAAKAFASRFYLYKGDWDKVIQYSSDILKNPATLLRDWAVKYRALGSDNVLPLYSSTEEPANVMVASGNCSQYWYYCIFNRFSLTLRLGQTVILPATTNPLGLSWAYGYVQYEVGGNIVIRKFRNNFVYTNAEAGVGNDYMAYVALTYDEVLMNRAEAYAMKGDNANAIADLTMLYTKKLVNYNPATRPLTEARILTTYPNAKTLLTPSYPFASDIQASLVQAVSELKRREFTFEGMRWFDNRRFNMEVTHTLTGLQNIVLTKNDPRKQLQIPQVALEFGLEPNNR